MDKLRCTAVSPYTGKQCSGEIGCHLAHVAGTHPYSEAWTDKETALIYRLATMNRNPGWHIPGWTCSNEVCGLFNGEMKEKLLICRGCGHARPDSGMMERNSRLIAAYREGRHGVTGVKKTLVDVAKMFGLGRSRTQFIIKRGW